jgi:uncharacterized membrane protein YfcA
MVPGAAMTESPGLAFYCTLSLFAGGLLKGVAGLGLPLAGMPLLTAALDIKTAIGVLVIPLIASNLAQSFEAGLFLPVFRRFWPVHLSLFVVAMLSTRALIAIPEHLLYLLIGAALIVCPTIVHLCPALRVRPPQERWMGPIAGAVAGFVGGVSTFYGAPLMLYLVWLRLPKQEFVVAVSQLFFVGALGLAIGLVGFGIVRQAELGVSALACLPVFLGLWLGQKVRVAMSEGRFARLVLLVYVATGVSFVVRSI